MDNASATRVVMVTGATSGIGRAVAKRFASSSSRVIAIGRNRSSLEEVKAEIRNSGGDPLTVALDVTSDGDVRTAFDEAINQTGRLDVLVNAAGHISTGTVENTSLPQWDAMMNVNLRSAFHLMQLAS